MKERSSSSPRAHLPPSVGRRFSSPTSAPAAAAGSGLGGGEGKGEGGGRRGLGRARAGMWMDGWMDGWMDEGAVFPLGSMEIYGHGIGRRRFSAEGGQVRPGPSRFSPPPLPSPLPRPSRFRYSARATDPRGLVRLVRCYILMQYHSCLCKYIHLNVHPRTCLYVRT